MNRLITAVCLGFLSLMLVVNTGESGDKEKKTEGKIKGMLPPGWKDLKLTADQKKQVYDIQKTYKSKAQAVEEQIIDLKSQEKGEMFNVLNEDQKVLLRRISTGEDTKKSGEKKKVEEKKVEEKKGK